MELLTMAEITLAMASQIPNTGVKISKIRTNGESKCLFWRGKKNDRQKEFARGKGGRGRGMYYYRKIAKLFSQN